MSCPIDVPLTVSRVTDQDAAFLRFLETHGLKPGQQIVVEARDEVSDSVRVRASDASSLTLGTRAASKLLVDVLAVVLVLFGLGQRRADAQTPDAQVPAPSDSSPPLGD